MCSGFISGAINRNTHFNRIVAIASKYIDRDRERERDKQDLLGKINCLYTNVSIEFSDLVINLQCIWIFFFLIFSSFDFGIDKVLLLANLFTNEVIYCT